MEYFDILIRVIEFIGIAAFAISGALVATESDFDFFGALVLGCTAAVGGGIIRDFVLGIVPPATFVKPIYLLIAASTSAVVFLAEFFGGSALIKRRKFYLQIINLFDALGLGIFVVLGVKAAMTKGYGENAFLVIFLGTVTGVGGGVARDILACRTPVILRKRIYALAAILGASLYYVLLRAKIVETVALLSGALCVILIRILATFFGWSLPKVPKRELPKND